MSVSSTQSLLAALWLRKQPEVLARLAILDAAATDPSLHAEALATAHKLAGSLGMFGYHEGTELARAYEQHLESGLPDTDTLTRLASQLRECLFPAERNTEILVTPE